VCFSLDMDERPKPGWRQALEAAWTPDLHLLFHPYQNGAKSHHACRFHSRTGFRWTGAYQEVLHWRAESSFNSATCQDIVVEHFSRHKSRPDELALLREGARESPHDSHRIFSYAAALLRQGYLQDGQAEMQRFIALGGSGDRLALLWRLVAQLDEPNAVAHLEQAQQASRNATNYLAFAEHYFRSQEWGLCYLSCQYALSFIRGNPQRIPVYTDDERLRGPLLHDLAAAAAWNLWDYEAAYATRSRRCGVPRTTGSWSTACWKSIPKSRPAPPSTPA